MDKKTISSEEYEKFWNIYVEKINSFKREMLEYFTKKHSPEERQRIVISLMIRFIEHELKFLLTNYRLRERKIVIDEIAENLLSIKKEWEYLEEEK